MKKIVVMLLVLSLLGSCVLALAEPAVLTVRGVGVVNLNADAASITMGVREIAEDVTSAQATVNRKIASVIEKMKEMGIEAKDIHTNYISIYPEYDYNDAKNPVVGYTAETSISVTTSDTENVGKYIDAAFEAGANTFSDISFSAAAVKTPVSSAYPRRSRQRTTAAGCRSSTSSPRSRTSPSASAKRSSARSSGGKWSARSTSGRDASSRCATAWTEKKRIPSARRRSCARSAARTFPALKSTRSKSCAARWKLDKRRGGDRIHKKQKGERYR